MLGQLSQKKVCCLTKWPEERWKKLYCCLPTLLCELTQRKSGFVGTGKHNLSDNQQNSPKFLNTSWNSLDRNNILFQYHSNKSRWTFINWQNSNHLSIQLKSVLLLFLFTKVFLLPARDIKPSVKCLSLWQPSRNLNVLRKEFCCCLSTSQLLACFDCANQAICWGAFVGFGKHISSGNKPNSLLFSTLQQILLEEIKPVLVCQ